MSASSVAGTLYTGTQQQYLFRNSAFNSGKGSAGSGVQYDSSGWNYVFVGSSGAPAASTTNKVDQITTVGVSPVVAGKPYLVSNRSGSNSSAAWSLVAPPILTNVAGLPPPDDGAASVVLHVGGGDPAQDTDVFVARSDRDTGSSINAGIRGKRGRSECTSVHLAT